MRANAEWKAAFAVMAAVAGAGFASGRELVLFFAQIGWASWIGIAFASVVFGLLIGVISHYARKTGASSFSGVYQRQLGNRSGDVIGILHALLMALTAAVMLVSCGELGALALPVRHGFLRGVVIALILALLINMRRLRALPWLGVAVVAMGVLFYAALAIDVRPVRIYTRSETELSLYGSVGAAILLAVLYASLNAAVAGGVIVRFSLGSVQPARLATLSGGMLCAQLLCANAAIARGGNALLTQAMPTVVLAARWGVIGFWLSIIFMYICAVSTLSSVIGALVAQMEDGGRQRRTAIMMLLTSFFLACAFGLSEVVDVGYPLLGWICAFAMAALACYYDRMEVRRRPMKALMAGRDNHDEK